MQNTNGLGAVGSISTFPHFLFAFEKNFLYYKYIKEKKEEQMPNSENYHYYVVLTEIKDYCNQQPSCEDCIFANTPICGKRCRPCDWLLNSRTVFES